MEAISFSAIPLHASLSPSLQSSSPQFRDDDESHEKFAKEKNNLHLSTERLEAVLTRKRKVN